MYQGEISMSELKVYPVPESARKRALIDNGKYLELYKKSVDDPDAFWGEQGKRLQWMKPYTKVKNTTYDYNNVSIKWYEDGELNACVNCLDRHLEKRGDQTALIYEGDDPNVSEHISYRKLYEETCKFANVLKAQGVKKGDVVTIYMPMIPQTAVAMLACARIGAVHSVVFGGFSPEALAGRIENGKSNIVITSDEGVRGGKPIPLKRNVDKALAKEGAKHVAKVVVFQRTGGKIDWVEGRDVWYHEEMAKVPADCPPAVMSAEDPLLFFTHLARRERLKG